MTDKERSGPPYGPPTQADLEMHLAYAEASVMLIECLMLVLMEKKVLPLESLVEAVETAIDAKRGLVKDGAHPQIANIAAGVLSKIANSLAATGEDGSPPMPE